MNETGDSTYDSHDSSSHRRRVVLIMSATITPKKGVKTQLADPIARLADYQKALLHYAGLLGSHIEEIVFVENSGSNITPLRQAISDSRCRFITFDATEDKPAYGYGYGEFRLLQYAMDSIADNSDNTLFVKVTGRYIVQNLPRFIRVAKSSDLVCDVRNRKKPWADLRVMAWSRYGFDTVLRNSYQKLRDDINKIPPEMILATVILQSRGVLRRTFLPFELHIEGRRGMDGKDWSQGSLQIKTKIRSVTRPIENALRLYPGAKGDLAGDATNI